MIVSASEVARQLASRVEGVCAHLLPTGKAMGGNWCAGSASGEKGDSLRVCLNGDKTGIWADFAGSEQERGDLLDLWATVRRLTIAEAIKEAKAWLGIADPTSHIPEKKYHRISFRSLREQGVAKVTPGSPVMDYLTKERKITTEILAKYRVAECGDEMAFPCLAAGKEEALNVTYIKLQRVDGKKQVRQTKDAAHILFGWQAIEPNTRHVVITEGQIDAMTWAQWGMDALSIPAGVNNFGWVDLDWDNLAQFDRIYLSFDMDGPGREAAVNAAKRLGIHRCFIVELPHKDANECLLNGVTGEDAARCILRAKALTPVEIKSPKEYLQQIIERFHPPADRPQAGLRTPLFGSGFTIRPGEMTLWSGHTSHGKTTLLSQLMLYAMMNDQGVAIGSFEIPPQALIARMVNCALYKASPSPEEIAQTVNWLSGKLWIYAMLGRADIKKLQELMLYSLMRHGVKHIVLDSLMKCDVNLEDYEAQRVFMDFLATFAVSNGIHVHLVAHPRKDKDDSQSPEVMDIHGGHTVTAQPDNVVMVWRNKEKEKGKNEKGPDTIVAIKKQRENGMEFSVPLWFNRPLYRFTAEKDNNGTPLFEKMHILTTEQK